MHAQIDSPETVRSLCQNGSAVLSWGVHSSAFVSYGQMYYICELHDIKGGKSLSADMFEIFEMLWSTRRNKFIAWNFQGCQAKVKILFDMDSLALCPDCRVLDLVWMADGQGRSRPITWSNDKMLARNRFLLLVVVGGAVLAILSLSLQFCKYGVFEVWCPIFKDHSCNEWSEWFVFFGGVGIMDHLFYFLFWTLVAIKETLRYKLVFFLLFPLKLLLLFFSSACGFVFTHAYPVIAVPFRRPHLYLNKAESPIDSLLITSSTSGPLSILCRPHICCGMSRWTQLCLFSIKSLFSIPFRYCLDSISRPAAVNARKPPLCKRRQACPALDVICKSCWWEREYCCLMKQMGCGEQIAKLFCAGFMKTPEAAQVLIATASLCLDERIGLDCHKSHSQDYAGILDFKISWAVLHQLF